MEWYMNLEQFKKFWEENRENFDEAYDGDEAIEDMKDWKHKDENGAITVWSEDNKLKFEW